MPKADVTYNTIGFVGTCASGGSTFTLYLDNEKTGAKTYHVYFKQLGGGTLTLTTGKAGASNLTLNSGTYVAIIYVDEEGNVTTQGTTVVNSVTVDNMQSVSSNAVARALNNRVGASQHSFANFFTANTYVSMADFVNKIVDMKVTRFGLVVMDLDSMLEVLSSL
jgi:hypothetical protein